MFDCVKENLPHTPFWRFHGLWVRALFIKTNTQCYCDILEKLWKLQTLLKKHTHTHTYLLLEKVENLLVLSCLINPSDLFGENFCVIMDFKLCNIFFNLTKMGMSQEDFTSYISWHCACSLVDNSWTCLAITNA